MNRCDKNYCHPHHKRKQKNSCSNNKIGLVMLLLGIVTILAIFLPAKYWVLLLSAALIILGIAILRSH